MCVSFVRIFCPNPCHLCGYFFSRKSRKIKGFLPFGGVFSFYSYTVVSCREILCCFYFDYYFNIIHLFLVLKVAVSLGFSREKYLFLFSFFLIIENIIYYGEKRELKSLVFSVFFKEKSINNPRNYFL